MPSLFPQKYYSTAYPQSQTNVRKFSNFSAKRHKVRYAQTAAQLARGRASRYAQTAEQLARGRASRYVQTAAQLAKTASACSQPADVSETDWVTTANFRSSLRSLRNFFQSDKQRLYTQLTYSETIFCVYRF